MSRWRGREAKSPLNGGACAARITLAAILLISCGGSDNPSTFSASPSSVERRSTFLSILPPLEWEDGSALPRAPGIAIYRDGERIALLEPGVVVFEAVLPGTYWAIAIVDGVPSRPSNRIVVD